MAKSAFKDTRVFVDLVSHLLSGGVNKRIGVKKSARSTTAKHTCLTRGTPTCTPALARCIPNQLPVLMLIIMGAGLATPGLTAIR